jgi:hypothetical protein
MSSKLKIIFLCGFVLVMQSCFKTSYKNTWDVITSGKGEWDIDYMEVTFKNYQSNLVEFKKTYESPGTLVFRGTEDAPVFDMNIQIQLQNIVFGPLENLPFTYFGSYLNLYLTQDLSGELIWAEILVLKKNKLVLYSPESMNSVIEGGWNLDFYFECSK